jgi:phage shock protein PspC (stress-responsive transcriptional regulator)
MTAPFIDDDVTVATNDPEPPEQSDRVVLGVAGLIADALGVDALWVRIGFVLLGLAGGVGVVLYLGLWLALIGPRSLEATWVRYLGGVVVVAGVPLMIAAVDIEIATGPLVVFVLLIALAVVLWQPRTERSNTLSRPLPPPVTVGLPSTASTTDDEVVSAELAELVIGADAGTIDAAQKPAASAVPRRRRPRRPRREPSVLGRWTLGVALIVASVGALVDQLNGGRLHPEQWLGAAAVVCGVGLLVGAVRGHARWLIVPALLLAVVGYSAGVLAGMGIGAGDAFGDRTISISGNTPGGEMAASVGAGQVWIGIDAVPDGPVTVDARVGFGNIDISANTDVAVEVRTDIDHGDARLYGQTQADDVMRLGPNRDPDVIVLARVGVGQINLSGYQMTPTPPQGETPLLGNGPFDPLVEAHSIGTQVTDGIGVSTDGWIVIAYGEALIDPNNDIVVGNVDPQSGLVYTQMGPFFVADGIITTPGGETFGLDDLRQQYSTPVPTGATVPESPEPLPPSTTTIAPSTTAIPEQTNTTIGD